MKRVAVVGVLVTATVGLAGYFGASGKNRNVTTPGASIPSAPPYTVAQLQDAFRRAAIVLERLPIPDRDYIALQPISVRKDGVFGILVFRSARTAQVRAALLTSRNTAFPVHTLRRRNVLVREETLTEAQSARMAIALKALSP